MMKLFISGLLLCITFSVMACPKGEHPYGGTGSHHKGGWCGN